MENILDYLAWRGDLSFRQSPFCEVDAAVFARLAYLPFEEVLSRGETMNLRKAAKKILRSPDVDKKVLSPLDLSLVEEILGGKRFAETEVLQFVSRIDPEGQTQFSAVTFRLDEKTAFLSFRGTDHTLVGWKEDFNMSFSFPVPAQLSAETYAAEVSEGLPEVKFYLGGHSKGGNLAVYAGAFCGNSLRERIAGVYNFDGPGFPEPVLEQWQYQAVLPYIKSFLPQSSVVGRLLAQEGDRQIVHSTSVGLNQHDIYSWEVKRNRFVYLEDTTPGSRHFDRTIKDWLTAMTPREREMLIEIFYQVITQTNATTLEELWENRLNNFRIVAKSLKNLDEKDRKLVSASLRLLFRSAKNEVLSV